MPPELLFPGVYVEEIPSNVHPIEGVSTATTTFVGWAAQGAIDGVRCLTSFQHFVSEYGGLDRRSMLGYAVQHFFANGGQEAHVIRLTARNARAASVTLGGTLTVTARSPGRWGNRYAVEIRACPNGPDQFTLAIWQRAAKRRFLMVERFDELSLGRESLRDVERVVADESRLVTVARTSATTGPPLTPLGALVPLSGGSDGGVLIPSTPAFAAQLRAAMPLLNRVERFNLLCVPGETMTAVVAELQAYCHSRRAFFIVDSAKTATAASLVSDRAAPIRGAAAINSALYFPWIKAPDPLLNNRVRVFPPCGFVAGMMARMDRSYGIWHTPAGRETVLSGATGARLSLSDTAIRQLNGRGINCIRTVPGVGTLVWGARTLAADGAEDLDRKYVSVRRLALFIEESIFRGTQWVIFESNDEVLWSGVRASVGAFLHHLFTHGALQGRTSDEAYFVSCDRGTMTEDDIAEGRVNIVVGFAPLRPAEFVVIRITQMVSGATEPQ
jgi:Bacteriophage tail sheath protein